MWVFSTFLTLLNIDFVRLRRLIFLISRYEQNSSYCHILIYYVRCTLQLYSVIYFSWIILVLLKIKVCHI